MAEDGEFTRGPIKRGDLARRSAEMDELEPFLELAREIKREVERVASDDSAEAESLTEVIDRIPREERHRVAQLVFDRLSPEDQWSVLERVFGDAELHDYLAGERDRRLSVIRDAAEHQTIAGVARSARRLDTRMVPEGMQVAVGLFREADTRAALVRGHVSDTCARRLVLHTIEPGHFRVIQDVFNPRGGYFVTREYDQATWQSERLAAHAVVRIGATSDDPARESFEPVLYPGGRVDFETDQGVIRGHLHVGFVMLGDVDVFAG